MSAARIGGKTLRVPGSPPREEDTSPTIPLKAKQLAAEHEEAARAHFPVIPGYEILRILGHGGMSTVFLARQIGLKRRVAIKMIRREDWNDSGLRERFRREALSIAALQHPHVVQIFEVGEANGIPFLVLEYVPGGTLHQRIRHRPQPAKFAARIAHQLAGAVQTAHDLQIIHRDLKPSNILLSGGERQKSPKGSKREKPECVEPLTPKITDFGLARFLEDDARQTRSGFALGTPSYMAPEQTSGHPDTIGKPADIYGLGTILYEMLTGRPPFEGDNALETVLMVRRDDPVPPSRLHPKTPRDLETICLKCLDKEPHRRYISAGELALDLERFLQDRPVHARPVGSLVRLTKWVKRRPGAAIAMVIMVLLFLALMASLGFAMRLNGRLKESGRQLALKNDELTALTEQQKQANRSLKERLDETPIDLTGWIRLARENPDDGWAQLRAYDALTAENRHAEARPYLERARELAFAASRRPNPPLEIWADLATVHERTGDHCLLLRDLKGAWFEHEEAFRLRTWLFEQDSHHHRWIFDLAASKVKIALLHLGRREPRDDHQAGLLLGQGLALLSSLPESTEVGEALLVAHERLAEVFRRGNQADLANEQDAEARKLREKGLQVRGKRFLLRLPLPLKK